MTAKPSDLFPGFQQARIEANGITLNLHHGGSGPPLLLLHGFPQTHTIWHRVAPMLARHFTLVMPDLRGYGDSDKPRGLPDHRNYSKRTMAQDMRELMRALGHERFFVCGHDRGGRVAHRLALDHADAVQKLMVIDISPTLTMYESTDMAFASYYYHWFFLIQPHPLPETLIGNNARYYVELLLGGWGSSGTGFYDPAAWEEYCRCFCAPEAIHGACEDYRASAGIDLEHDRVDEKIACPTHVVWGTQGIIGKMFAPLSDWQAKCAREVTGKAFEAGHFIPDQCPELLELEMLAFFG